MPADDDQEDVQLRAVSLQNANAIFLARQRADRELLGAKEALRKSEELLRSITDATPALIAYLDSSFRYRFANLQYAIWFGRPQEQLIGLHMREVLGNEAFARLEPHVVRALAGEDVHFEAEVPYRDAGTRFVKVAYHPDRAEDGAVRGVYVLVIDISDIKRTEDALRQTESRLLMAMEAGQMGAWEWDVVTGKVSWSPTLEAIHGMATGTFGGSFEDFQRDMHPEDRGRVLATIRESVEKRTDYRIEYRIVKPDGTVTWIEARGKLFLDAQRQSGADGRTLHGRGGTQTRRGGAATERTLQSHHHREQPRLDDHALPRWCAPVDQYCGDGSRVRNRLRAGRRQVVV